MGARCCAAPLGLARALLRAGTRRWPRLGAEHPGWHAVPVRQISPGHGWRRNMSNGKLPPVRNPAASLGTPLRLVAARSQLAPSEPLRRSLKMPHPRGGWETQPVFPNLRRHPTPCAGRNVWGRAKAGRRWLTGASGKSPTAAAANAGENGRVVAGEVIGKLGRRPARESSRAHARKAKERRPGGPLKRAGKGPGNRRAMGGGTRWANPAGHCPAQPALSRASTTSTIFCCRRRGSLAAA